MNKYYKTLTITTEDNMIAMDIIRIIGDENSVSTEVHIEFNDKEKQNDK